VKQDRVIERAEHLSRCAWILACEVVVQSLEIGQRGARGLYSMRHQLRARPGASANPESSPISISEIATTPIVKKG